jgi:hypothetical protein
MFIMKKFHVIFKPRYLYVVTSFVVSVMIISCSGPFADQYSKSFNMMIKNNTEQMRSDEVITLDIADIKSTHSDFNADAVIVLHADKELPSQINDLDRDGSGDKLVFLTDMKPGEHQSIVVRYNPEGEKQRSYIKRTQAELSHKFGGKFVNRVYEGGTFKNVKELHVPPEHTDHSWFIRYEGPGWESDKVGYRFYLDWRNATDIFGKKTHNMVLQNVGQDGFSSYHEMSEWGQDILKVGESLGIGSVGIWHNNKANRVAVTDSIYSVITANGPIQSSVRTKYYGWKMDNFTTDLTVDLSINAGSRETQCSLSLSQKPENICTGIVKEDSVDILKSDGQNGWQYFATYGKQSLAGDSLGMAILYKSQDLINFEEDEFSNVLVLKPTSGKLDYYFLAAWEQELDGLKNKKEFSKYLEEAIEKLNNPVEVTLN